MKGEFRVGEGEGATFDGISFIHNRLQLEIR
jgi:hypothetical protein